MSINYGVEFTYMNLIELLTEFAVSQYANCLCCSKIVACVDCYADFKQLEPQCAVACLDENEMIRYYLTNFDHKRNKKSKINEYYFLNDNPKILCLSCSINWNCKTCHFQATENNGYIMQCSLCFGPLCLECAYKQCNKYNKLDIVGCANFEQTVCVNCKK